MRPLLNNPNEGDKFAYWGEGGDAFGPRWSGFRPEPASRLGHTATIAIAGVNDRDHGTRGGEGGVRRGPGLTGDVRTHHRKGFSA